jgi:hypothetical protein
MGKKTGSGRGRGKPLGQDDDTSIHQIFIRDYNPRSLTVPHSANKDLFYEGSHWPASSLVGTPMKVKEVRIHSTGEIPAESSEVG